MLWYFCRDPTGFDPDLTWEASSYLNKYDDKYNLVLTLKNYKTGSSHEESVVKSVANFIDENGVVIPELVESVVTQMHDNLVNKKEK